jgi:CBS-domain-containing membrane protein
MSKDIAFCRESASLDEVAKQMRERKVRRMLVLTDQDSLAGIVSLGDLAVRATEERLSEETLEEVSEPSHPSA